jgi:hypothetical protein
MRRGPACLAALALAAAPALTGCTQFLSIDQRALVTSLGLDLAPRGSVAVTAEWYSGANPATVSGTGSANGADAVVHTAEGANVGQALIAMQARAARRVDLSITGTLVIGEAAARLVGRRAIDFAFRNSEFPIEAYGAVAVPTAAAVLAGRTPGGVGYKLYTHLRNANSTFNTSLAVPVWRFLSDSEAPCQGADLPLFAPDPQGVRAIGTALFAGGRMVASLSPAETATLGYLVGQAPYADLIVAAPGHQHPLTLRVRSLTVRRGVDGNAAWLGVDAVADAREAEGVTLDTARRRDLDALASRQLLAHLVALVTRLQRDGTDLTGLGRLACARRPALAAVWSATFRTLPIALTAHVHVTSDGRVT